MDLSVVIIDYDSGNLRNVQKAFESLGYPSIISNSVKDIVTSDVMILPGVGAFHDGMDVIEKLELSHAIRQQVLKNKKPILGICLGMQLFAKEGFEGGKRPGLGLLPMVVDRLCSEEQGCRLPHIGWNNVKASSKSILFNGIQENPDFYFVHSYCVISEEETIVSGVAHYGHTFIAAVEYENIFATQFHPEKSQRYGLQVLKNFMTFCESKTIR